MSKEQFPDLLIADALGPYGIVVTPQLASAIRAYANILILWNQRITLTSVRGPLQILRSLFGESLFALNLVDLSKGRLADVGSGAGFPGLAIKLGCPNLSVCPIESNTKKAAFLAEIVRRLELPHVEVIRQRMEEYCVEPGSFDFVTARALGQFPRLLRWTRTVLRDDGKMILWLGREGVSAVKLIKGWVWSEPALIPNTKARVIVIGRKVVT